MPHYRKYRAGAYIPRILEILAASPSPMTRGQIAAQMGVSPTNMATAMLDLTRSGEIVKLPHTPHVAASYRLPIRKPAVHHDKRTWYSPQAFPWNVPCEVSLPKEPWA